jgi:hypothetical protein
MTLPSAPIWFHDISFHDGSLDDPALRLVARFRREPMVPVATASSLLIGIVISFEFAF